MSHPNSSLHLRFTGTIFLANPSYVDHKSLGITHQISVQMYTIHGAMTHYVSSSTCNQTPAGQRIA